MRLGRRGPLQDVRRDAVPPTAGTGNKRSWKTELSSSGINRQIQTRMGSVRWHRQTQNRVGSVRWQGQTQNRVGSVRWHRQTQTRVGLMRWHRQTQTKSVVVVKGPIPSFHCTTDNALHTVAVWRLGRRQSVLNTSMFTLPCALHTVYCRLYTLFMVHEV